MSFHLTLPNSVTKDSVAVVWGRADNAEQYEVFVNGRLYASTKKTHCTITDLNADSNYEIYVTANNIKSNTICAKTKVDFDIFNVLDFGAVGDGKTVNTAAIQNAIDKCCDGGTVYIPDGVFVSGAIFLKSNMTLCVDGVLLGSRNISDYPIMRYRFEGMEQDCYASLVNTGNAENQNITVCGKGTINANGMPLYRAELDENKGKRGRAVCIRNTDGLYIKDITIRESPSWCLHTIYCNNVTFNNIKIHTKYNEQGEKLNIHNGDGIDIDSTKNVYIFNSMIASQDDCIAIKSGRDDEGRKVGIASGNIRISDCTFNSGFGVAIGSEMSGGVKDVYVSDCDFKDTYSIGSVKAPRGRGGMIDNIVYENCTLDNENTEYSDCKWFRGGIYIDQFYSHDDFDIDKKETVNDGTAKISNIKFKNIKLKTVTGNAIYLAGLAESFLENITLENINAIGKYGMKAYNIDRLKMDNVQVHSMEDKDYDLKNVREI